MPEINANVLAVGLIWYVVFLFSTVLHEASHALIAHLGGDDTAASGGQVGLDPIPHLQREPMGMLLVPWVSFLLNGWMMGWASAPYDPLWADRYPHRAARMALAGPVANFTLMGIAAAIIRLGLTQGWLSPHGGDLASLVSSHGDVTALCMILSIAFSLNLLLGCFNLLPLPPLDGSGAICLLMPEDLARRWMEITRQPGLRMMGMLVAWFGFGYIFAPIFGVVSALLFAGF